MGDGKISAPEFQNSCIVNHVYRKLNQKYTTIMNVELHATLEYHQKVFGESPMECLSARKLLLNKSLWSNLVCRQLCIGIAKSSRREWEGEWECVREREWERTKGMNYLWHSALCWHDEIREIVSSEQYGQIRWKRAMVKNTFWHKHKTLPTMNVFGRFAARMGYFTPIRAFLLVL